MSTMSIRMPNSLHRRLREMADADGVSINQFVTCAVSEKMAALATLDYLEARAEKGSRDRFEAALQQVPDIEPDSIERD